MDYPHAAPPVRRLPMGWRRTRAKVHARMPLAQGKALVGDVLAASTQRGSEPAIRQSGYRRTIDQSITSESTVRTLPRHTDLSGERATNLSLN